MSALGAPIPDMIKHVTLALGAHVRRLHRDALPVPREVEELALFLMHLARTRQDAPPVVDPSGHTHNEVMPDRLLITKGEAARRLGVSVRTVERLVANGRLPQVHVERLARIRVSDLEAFTHSLEQCQTPRQTAETAAGVIRQRMSHHDDVGPRRTPSSEQTP
jgi:excisionase family DNA binding protein